MQTNVPTRISAMVALVGLQSPTEMLLREAFRRFGIGSVTMTTEEALLRIAHEKMEACVVNLDDRAASVLSVVRTAPSNHRMIVYGVCASAQQALSFSRFGINATFDEPLDRQNVLRVVRSTYLLVIHELRRYVRIPLVTEVRVVVDGLPARATMREISGGGLSMETSLTLKVGDACEVTFQLPNLSSLTLASRVAWVRPDQRLAGLRFEPQEQNRFRVKNWIDQYLDDEST